MIFCAHFLSAIVNLTPIVRIAHLIALFLGHRTEHGRKRQLVDSLLAYLLDLNDCRSALQPAFVDLTPKTHGEVNQFARPDVAGEFLV
jgi:hypothetical protein